MDNRPVNDEPRSSHHTVVHNRRHTRPRHCDLIGRRAGSVPGFIYSSAMRKSRISWTEANLDLFIKAPMAFIPGTAMGYDGIKNDTERHDLLAFLRQEGLSEKCRSLGAEHR